MDIEYPVFCPLMGEKIAEEVCFDVHCVIDGAPKRFAPSKVFQTENYEEICRNCKYHRDD